MGKKLYGFVAAVIVLVGLSVASVVAGGSSTQAGFNSQQPASTIDYPDGFDNQSKAGTNRWPARTATVTVCASNALKQRQCDYVADGVDDHIEIQAGIDSLPSSGGKVVLSEGTFSVNGIPADTANNGIIVVRSNVHLAGMGPGTVVKLADGYSTPVGAIITVSEGGVGNSNVVISDFTLDGNRDNTAGHQPGIGSHYTDPYLGSPSNNVSVHGMIVKNTSGHGIQPYRAERWIISDNIIQDTTNTGLYVDITNNSTVEGNILLNTSGLWLDGSSHNTIIGNSIQSNWAGIALSRGAQGNTIAGNTVVGSGYWGVLLDPDVKSPHYGQVSDNVISGNHIAGSRDDGLKIDYVEENPATRNIITGNTITGGLKHGMNLGGSQNIISNNIVESNSQYYDNTYDNILLGPGADYNFITANTVRSGGGTNQPRYGVNVSAGTGNLVRGNDLYDAGRTANLNNVGAGTVVADNRGYSTDNSGTATITGGNTSVTVAHGLSIAPDMNRIHVTPRDNLAGLSFWVSDVTATTFVLNISSSDTVDHVFGWSYAD